MSIFSGAKKKDELILVFNIGSSSVGGALFWAQESGIPKIIFTATELIQIENTIDIERFLSTTLKSLEIVAKNIFDAHLGVPSKIFCVLSSPWHFSETRLISFKKNTPFIFNTKLADELIQKEVKIFEAEHLTKDKNFGSLVRAIELKNIKTKLNGYEVSQLLNQKAQEAEMTIFISISGENILKKIEDTIHQHFNIGPIKFSSFVLASFTIVRDMYAKQEDFLLIDIGGEVTDITMVKKNVLRESVSFPLGRNFLLRGVASGLNVTLNEASSLLSLFKEGHAEKSASEQISSVIVKLKKEWLQNFQNSLANISHDISIPATIYMAVEKDALDFFKEAIMTEQFSQYTLTESKFEVIFLSAELLHGVATFEEKAVHDTFLAIDSIYINRFFK